MMNNISEARRSYEASLPEGKFTQQDAADYFGVKVGTYSHWEQGVGKLNGEILCKIADKYGCSVDYLLCRVDDPTPYPRGGAGGLDDGERKLVDDYRATNPIWQQVIKEQAATAAKEHPKTKGESAERRTA